MMKKIITVLLVFFFSTPQIHALERPGMEFKIFQFPRTMIPRIDGRTDDWNIVGKEYTYCTDLLDGTKGGHGKTIDTTDIDVKVRVGWVKDLNRLYFLYEAYDDYWDFGIFEGGGYRND
ncbi:MAG TPA: PKD domain containing protein, partial [bacterium]|nr:PKD domain containing protein [bacterium]